jgi:hypothetical protein
MERFVKKLLYVCEADSGGIMEYAIRQSAALAKAADRIGFEIVKLEENAGFGIAWVDAPACKS